MRRFALPLLFAAAVLAGLAALFLLHGPRRPGGKPGERPDPGRAVLESLSGWRKAGEAIHPFRDESGVWHIRMDLSRDRFSEMIPALEKTIAALDGRIVARTQERRAESLLTLWKIGGREAREPRLLAFLLFVCPLDGGASPPPPRPGRPRAAIIIDDAGYNLDLVRELAGLGRPLTIAVLPDAPLAAETARLAAATGLEVMLHVPLQPAGKAPGAPIATIRPGMNRAAVRGLMESFLDKVPGARGANNHTGSLATEDAAVMAGVLGVLKERGLYFIDSTTTRDSLAYAAARAMAVPAAERRVFLDPPEGRKTVAACLDELFRAARKNGSAVGIGHARRALVEAPRAGLAGADEAGVDLVFAGAVVR